MAWKNYIDDLKKKYIGKRIFYAGKIYNIVNVDYNGVIHIDLQSEHNKTIAVYMPWEADNNIVQEAKR